MRALVFAQDLLLFDEFLAAYFPCLYVCLLFFNQLGREEYVSMEYRLPIVWMPHLANGWTKIRVFRGDLAHAAEALLPFCNG